MGGGNGIQGGADLLPRRYRTQCRCHTAKLRSGPDSLRCTAPEKVKL